MIEGTAEAYADYKRRERGLSEAGKLELWQTLPEETRKAFRQLYAAKERRRSLRRYTLGVVGILAVVAVAIALVVVSFAVRPHSYALGSIGFVVVMLGWIPFAQMASSAKSELLRE